MPLKRAPSVATLTAFAILAVAAPARADVKEDCVDASTQGQSLRDAGKLKDARDHFVECARDACPSIVRKACADWLADVDGRVPTIVFRAQLDGNDVLDARLSIDGAPVAHGLEGAAIALEPGEHTVRFERDGSAPIEERLVVVEGEKGRVVTGRFARLGSPKAATEVTTTDATGGSADPDTSRDGRRITALPIVLASVGGVGLVSFASFGLVASGDLNHLRQTCAPYCTSSQLDSVKTEALVADISLGVGVVALAAAVYVFLTQSPAKPSSSASSSATFTVSPAPGGGFAQVVGRF